MPRFEDENQAIKHIAKEQSISEKSAEEKYAYWRKRKRFMFSHKERDEYGKDNKEQKKDHVNKWADDAEGLPRRRAIIIVRANQLNPANNFAKQIDPVQDAETFGGSGLSETGKSPATHYGISWNCTSSEYSWLEQRFDQPSIRHFYDGDKVTWEEALKDMGLVPIQEGPLSVSSGGS